VHIEDDDEFVALMRERFASRPYSTNPPNKYWTPERYEQFIAELLETQREIRSAALNPPGRRDDMSPEELDRATAAWAIWSIQTHDVGATPTHWHRVWSAMRSVIAWTRDDERRRIASALRRDNAAMVGPTAAELIASDIVSDDDGST
jgi:hypothetical protein